MWSWILQKFHNFIISYSLFFLYLFSPCHCTLTVKWVGKNKLLIYLNDDKTFFEVVKSGQLFGSFLYERKTFSEEKAASRVSCNALKFIVIAFLGKWCRLIANNTTTLMQQWNQSKSKTANRLLLFAFPCILRYLPRNMVKTFYYKFNLRMRNNFRGIFY